MQLIFTPTQNRDWTQQKSPVAVHFSKIDFRHWAEEPQDTLKSKKDCSGSSTCTPVFMACFSLSRVWRYPAVSNCILLYLTATMVKLYFNLSFDSKSQPTSAQGNIFLYLIVLNRIKMYQIVSKCIRLYLNVSDDIQMYQIVSESKYIRLYPNVSDCIENVSDFITLNSTVSFFIQLHQFTINCTSLYSTVSVCNNCIIHLLYTVFALIVVPKSILMFTLGKVSWKSESFPCKCV